MFHALKYHVSINLDMFEIYTFYFYKNSRLIFVQNLRTILSSAEEQSLRFSIKVVN